MPHQVDPRPTPVMISKTSTPSAAPPTREEMSSLLNTIFTAKTSQESLDASYALTNVLLSSTGFRGLQAYNVVSEIKAGAADKKNGARRESAMILVGALFERLIPSQPISEVPFMIQDKSLVATTFDLLADKGPVVRESAQYALDALFKNLSPESLVVGLIPVITSYLEKRSGKWQGTVGAYELLGRMADKAKMGTGSKEEERSKDLLRESMGKKLAGLIPVVEAGMHDLKSEVSLSQP